MNKDRQIISELHNFFTESGCGVGIQRLMSILGTINITERQIAFIQMLILFPFFAVKNAANFYGSSLQVIFDCRKDMFYRILSNDRIDWRHILRYVNKKLMNAICVRSDARNSEYPVCLIADDTDMPKTGRKGEILGRVFSHVENRGSILGHKGLFYLSYRWTPPDASRLYSSGRRRMHSIQASGSFQKGGILAQRGAFRAASGAQHRVQIDHAAYWF